MNRKLFEKSRSGRFSVGLTASLLVGLLAVAASSVSPELIGLAVAAIFFLTQVHVPMSEAFIGAIASARDPGHRVTPLGAWRFFWRSFWRKIRWWLVVWIVLIVAVPAALTLMDHTMSVVHPEATPMRIPMSWRMMKSLVLTLRLLWLPVILFVTCIWSAPRFKNPWTILAATFPTAVLTIVFAAGVLMLVPFHVVEFSMYSRGSSGSSIGQPAPFVVSATEDGIVYSTGARGHGLHVGPTAFRGGAVIGRLLRTDQGFYDDSDKSNFGYIRSVSLFFVYLDTVTLALLLVAVYWAVRKGDAWFRFET